MRLTDTGGPHASMCPPRVGAPRRDSEVNGGRGGGVWIEVLEGRYPQPEDPWSGTESKAQS